MVCCWICSEPPAHAGGGDNRNLSERISGSILNYSVLFLFRVAWHGQESAAQDGQGSWSRRDGGRNGDVNKEALTDGGDLGLAGTTRIGSPAGSGNVRAKRAASTAHCITDVELWVHRVVMGLRGLFRS